MRYLHGEKPKSVWPPPYPAWPEIADPSTLYILPTVASHPAIRGCLWKSKWWYYGNSADSAKSFTDRELIYVMFPDDAEELLAKLPPTTEDIYPMVLRLLDQQTITRGYVRLFAAMGIADPEWSEFANEHEMGHFLSFLTTRPTIVELNRIASGIFALFKKLTLTACENFWDEFQKYNDTLVNYLDQALILEELRANLHAYYTLDPIIKANIEPNLRKKMTEDAISLLDTLADVTNEDWNTAYWLSIMAEFSPKDPIKRLHFLCKREVTDYWKKKLKVATKQWHEPGWEVQLVEHMYEMPEIFFTPINEDAGSAVHPLNLSDVRELVFLESLRQQLAQFFGVSLVCPFQYWAVADHRGYHHFQTRGRTCCGFGHYMRAIWEKTLPEYRSAKAILHPKTDKEIVVRPPRKACLHYGLG
jgi:hypothetical protein